MFFSWHFWCLLRLRGSWWFCMYWCRAFFRRSSHFHMVRFFHYVLVICWCCIRMFFLRFYVARILLHIVFDFARSPIATNPVVFRHGCEYFLSFTADLSVSSSAILFLRPTIRRFLLLLYVRYAFKCFRISSKFGIIEHNIECYESFCDILQGLAFLRSLQVCSSHR